MRLRLFLLACLITVCASALLPQNTDSRIHDSTPLLYTAAPEYRPLAWLQGGERFPRGATVFLKNSRAAKPLVSGFFSTADANASFDGKAVLFSGKSHAADHWQVWEFAIVSREIRQITYCDDDCVRPLYVPGGQFVYARKHNGRFTLQIASLSQLEKPLQLTYAPGSFMPSDVLRDGRILFESGYPLAESKIAELYTVYPDGSGVEAYRCDHSRSRYDGKQISSGDVVFTQDGKLFRFTSALAQEVEVRVPRSNYAGDIVETSSGVWIASSKQGAEQHFQLRTWKPGTPALLPLVTNSRLNLLQPAVLAARPLPNLFPSALHDWPYANVLCLNAYTSKERIPEGSVAAVRLYTRDSQGAAQLQGTAQVEKDGSFYLRVPGDRPLRIELLDASGKTVKSEAGWFWLRSGEQRICVGCHAGPERAPENAIPAVLQRSTDPADFTTTAVHTSAAGGH